MSVSSSQGFTSKRTEVLAVLQHLVHVSLVIPRFHIKKNRGLSNESWLLGFLLSTCLQSLLSDPFLLLRLLFVITAEEINVIVIIITCCSGSSSSGIIRCILTGLGELFHTSSE